MRRSSLRAGVVDDPLLDPLLTGGVGYVREVMLAVGRWRDGMIVSSWAAAAHRAGDGEGAAVEMEKYLRGCLYAAPDAAEQRGDRGGASEMTALIDNFLPRACAKDGAAGTICRRGGCART